jgi:hypothetical protein
LLSLIYEGEGLAAKALAALAISSEVEFEKVEVTVERLDLGQISEERPPRITSRHRIPRIEVPSSVFNEDLQLHSRLRGTSQSIAKVRDLSSGSTGPTAVEQLRFDLAAELLGDLRHLDEQLKFLHKRIREAVRASGTAH